MCLWHLDATPKAPQWTLEALLVRPRPPQCALAAPLGRFMALQWTLEALLGRPRAPQCALVAPLVPYMAPQCSWRDAYRGCLDGHRGVFRCP